MATVRRLVTLALAVLVLAPGSSAQAADQDGDGVEDALDNCPTKPNAPASPAQGCTSTAAGVCSTLATGCTCLQLDTDWDGYGNTCDFDYDNDGTVGLFDWLRFGSHYGQTRSDSAWDDRIDMELDANGDDAINLSDYLGLGASYGKPLAPGLPCAGTTPCLPDPDGDHDYDEDGVVDSEDNCVIDPNLEQIDSDNDGFGNVCDGDLDNDGVLGDWNDADPRDDADSTICSQCKTSVTDLNGDGAYGNLADSLRLGVLGSRRLPGPGRSWAHADPASDSYGDADGDLVKNYQDNCRDVVNPGQQNANPTVDQFGNACDADYNNDGVIDETDQSLLNEAIVAGPPYDPAMDWNADGVVDERELAFFAQLDTTRPGPSGLCQPPHVLTAQNARIPVIAGGTRTGTLPTADGLPGGGARIYAVTTPLEGLVVDPSTGAFTYTAPAEETIDPSFTFTVRDDYGTSLEGRIEFEIWKEQNSSFDAASLRNATLVVFNENYAPAAEIAQHYKGRRGLADDHVCAVSMPNGLYATKDQMLSMREQILKHCICPLIPGLEPPAPCEPGDPAIAAGSPITHLALIKGLPARMYATGWPDDYWQPSLDFYLAYLLYRNEELFDCGLETCPGPARGQFVNNLYDQQFVQPATGRPEDQYRRALDPARDRFVAYGRIEAMTPQRTKDLIDRTWLAEQEGLVGNVLTNSLGDFLSTRDLTASLASECIDYVTGPVSWSWNRFAECRAATTYSEAPSALDGALPGGAGAAIAEPLDVGLYVGNNPWPNGQAGFNNMATLREWHKSSCTCDENQPNQNRANCNELCDPNDAVCIGQSTDFFKELDTRCVGASPGFIGYQRRSFPVSYYGFFPDYWGVGDSSSAVPAEVRTGGAFNDSYYLHMGVHDVDEHDSSICRNVDGTSSVCPEAIGTWLTQQLAIAAPDSATGERTYRVCVQYRSQTAGELTILLGLVTAGPSVFAPAHTIHLDATDTWLQGCTDIPLDPGADSATGLDFKVTLDIRAGIRGFLDLDDIELRLLDGSGAEIYSYLSPDVGSFALGDRHQATHQGDWAANAIDRLGAIGWWGSSSHHLTSGNAFGNTERMIRSFFSGRTLGESVVSSGNGESGIIYADPLYRPAAAALFLPGELFIKPTIAPYGEPPLSGAIRGLIVTQQNLENVCFLFMSALNGTGGTTQWFLDTCPVLDPAVCQGWTEKQSATGSLERRKLDWTTLLDTPGNQQVTIRLRVGNTANSNVLYDFASFDYRPNETP